MASPTGGCLCKSSMLLENSLKLTLMWRAGSLVSFWLEEIFRGKVVGMGQSPVSMGRGWEWGSLRLDRPVRYASLAFHSSSMSGVTSCCFPISKRTHSHWGDWRIWLEHLETASGWLLTSLRWAKTTALRRL